MAVVASRDGRIALGPVPVVSISQFIGIAGGLGGTDSAF
tara:strand:+ start:500 stop:616 length:117 start_codon:yes stop_codon:yes gene_type:complete